MNHKAKVLLFLLVLSIGVFFRLYKVTTVPPSPSLDEVSLGWNAYSIGTTGKDEYGISFPILLRAYDDYRPAFYVYLVVPFVKLFGLTVLAVRLPAVILSILTIVATYGIVSLFQKPEMELKIGSVSLTPALMTTFFLSISPWHIYISRLGHEVNAGSAFLIVGLYSFLLYVKRNKSSVFLYIASFFFALSFGSYQSEKIVLPLFVGLAVFIYRKRVFINKRTAFIALCIGFIFSLPTLISSFSAQGMTRFSGTSAFSNTSFFYQQEQAKFVTALQNNNLYERILYSPKIRPIKIFLQNYSDHFKIRWLFQGGELDQHKVPNTGLLYLWEGALILAGIYSCFRRKEYHVLTLSIGLLLISILPAAITTQTPHAMRSFTVIPMYQIIEGIGMIWLLKLLQNHKIFLFGTLFLVIIPWSIFQMSYNYFHVFPLTQSDSFGYAFADSMEYIRQHQKDYDHVVLTNTLVGKRYEFQSYMFFLYYSKFDPKTYLSLGGTKTGGIGQSFSLGKFEFKDLKNEVSKSNTLYLSNPDMTPAGTKIIHESKFLDGSIGARIEEG